MLSNCVLVTEWPKLHEYAGAFCSSAWYLTLETLRLPGDSFLQQFSKYYFPLCRIISCALSDRVLAGYRCAAILLWVGSARLSWHTVRRSCITSGGVNSVFKVRGLFVHLLNKQSGIPHIPHNEAVGLRKSSNIKGFSVV